MSFLRMELIPFVRQWQEEFDEPVHKMISRLDIDGLWVNPGESAEEIAQTIAGFAMGRDLDGELRRRIAQAKEPDGEGDDLNLEALLIEHLSTTEWDSGWIGAGEEYEEEGCEHHRRDHEGPADERGSTDSDAGLGDIDFDALFDEVASKMREEREKERLQK